MAAKPESPAPAADARKFDFLTKEKSLWGVWLEAQKLGPPRFAYWTSIVVGALMLMLPLIISPEIDDLRGFTRDLAKSGLDLSLNMLGLFLAGFGVYLALIREKMVAAMVRFRHPSSGLPYLKHNVLNYIVVFIYYLVFSVVFFVIWVLHYVPVDTQHLSATPKAIWGAFCWSSISVTTAGFCFLIIQLKSLIFNLYHAFMSNARWIAEDWDSESAS